MAFPALEPPFFIICSPSIVIGMGQNCGSFKHRFHSAKTLRSIGGEGKELLGGAYVSHSMQLPNAWRCTHLCCAQLRMPYRLYICNARPPGARTAQCPLQKMFSKAVAA